MGAIEDIRSVTVCRYITPLREGGSLPALAEADDDFKYVLKFRGAGHGVKALIAEFLGGEIARAIGMRVPELVFANLHEAFGRTEGDEEIQDLLQGSKGLNLAMHFLSGAINFDPAVTTVDDNSASKIVWLDAFITNVDRTYRNTNMLMWNRELWLIDHGASFFFHHSWNNLEKHAKSPFSFIKEHVLLPQATRLEDADKEIKQLLNREKLREIVTGLPDDWLQWQESNLSPQEIREAYIQFLLIRLDNSNIFIKEAQNARKALI
ncbi:HipA family kinase [Salinimicrobium sp. HB62]|uniref:HipA family kinase n=1 Tax=Salinimicrobium sp. HB62 TaxID=3077781 RepID=UPI002D76C28F|nr:HipA family kinase [Salinimicrobium sp. HB62]